MRDSVGVEKINGILYVIHEVEEKETLYALFRRYGTSVKDIIAANPGSENGLEIGQRVKIPLKVSVTDQPKLNTGGSHIVAQGETLFSISKRYGVKMEEVKQWNGLANNDLEIGQRLIVSKGKQDKTVESTVRHTKSESKNISHVVAPGETLFSLSRSTGATVDQLKEWNNLVDDNLSIGQELIIGVKESGREVTETVKDATDERVVTKQTDNNDPFKDSRVAEGEKNRTTPESVKVVEKPDNTALEESGTLTKIKKQKDSDTNFEEVIDSGQAELIEGSANTRKYLALHRTAKIGTIMKVKNEMNGQEVFVRVLGKLPDTDINKNVLIKISKAAYNRLGAIDQKFRVSISYIP